MILRILGIFLMPMVVWAAPDEIWVQGVKYPLPFAPLEPYLKLKGPVLRTRKSDVLYRPREYVATWEIRDKALYLLRVSRVERESNNREWLEDVTAVLFPGKQPPILATWFTGTLVLDEVPPWKRPTTANIIDGVIFLGFERGKLTNLLVQSVEEARKNP